MDGWASNHFSHLRRAKVETKLDIYRNHARAIGHPSLLWSLVSVKTIVRVRCARVAFSQIRDELLVALNGLEPGHFLADPLVAFSLSVYFCILLSPL
jgi:hypothetical protein